MFKKILLVIVGLAAIVAGALAIFIVTFDLNQYRPQLEQRLETLLGNAVSIEDVSIGWRNGITMDVNGLSVYPGHEASGEPVMTLDRASATLEIGPLLSRNLHMSSILLKRPSLHLVRFPQGQVKLLGADLKRPVPSGDRPPRDPSPAGTGLFAFLVREAKLSDGKLRFTDNHVSPPIHIDLQRVDLKLEDISLTQPISFDLSFAIAKENRNVQASGAVRLPRGGRVAQLESFRLAADLEGLDVTRLNEILRGFGGTAFTTVSSGVLEVNLDQLDLSSDLARTLGGSINFSNGSFQLKGLGAAFTDGRAQLALQPNQIEVKLVRTDFAGGAFSGVGTINKLQENLKAVFSVDMKSVLLSKMLPPAGTRDTQLQGTLAGSVQATTTGPNFAKNLTGNGKLVLTDGVILNLNILREVFNRLSIIPGLLKRLQSRLPEDYQQRLDVPHTEFAPIEQNFSLQGDSLYFESMKLLTQDFDLVGSGRIRFNQTIDARATLRIDPYLSEAFIRSVSELEQLRDSEGRLVIPITIRGPFTKVKVVPDVGSVATQFAVTKAQNLLTDLLR